MTLKELAKDKNLVGYNNLEVYSGYTPITDGTSLAELSPQMQKILLESNVISYNREGNIFHVLIDGEIKVKTQKVITCRIKGKEKPIKEVKRVKFKGTTLRTHERLKSHCRLNV
jgi:hypothetical protein